MQSEGPGIGTPVRIQRNLLDDLCSSLGLANDVRWHRGVIHIPWQIGAVSSALPDAQAEVSVLCRARGIHDFRSIAMPYHHRVVDDHSTGDGNGLSILGLRGKDHVPHSDNGLAVVVAVECRQYELRCCRAILRAPVGRLDRLVWQTALGHSSRSYGEDKSQRAHARSEERRVGKE